MKHTLSVLVENKPGALTRITSMFARRGFNIESLAVGPTERHDVSRITLRVDCEVHSVEQIEKQMHKLVNVLRVTELLPGESVERELALLKVAAPPSARAELMALGEVFKARIADLGPDSIVFELTGTPEEVDSFEELVRPHGAPGARPYRPYRAQPRTAARPRPRTSAAGARLTPRKEPDRMATIHRDGDLDLLDGKVAVVGFGSQGHAHALNLHDSGVDVRVGLRDGQLVPGGRGGGRSRGRHRPDAVAGRADRRAARAGSRAEGRMGVGGRAEPRAGRRRALRARAEHPLRPDRAARRPRRDHGRAEGAGPSRPRALRVGRRHAGLVAVQQDASGRALELALAYGVGIGCGRVGLLETTFAEETESDLFGEQAVLCGGVPALVQAGFDTLVEAGYQPEIAYYECLNELKLIVDLLYEGGFEYMRYSISDVAEYGDLSRGTRVVDDGVRARMREILDEIRSGAFAKELFADDEAGRPQLRAAARGGPEASGGDRAGRRGAARARRRGRPARRGASHGVG